ncbi:MAG: hypothetical protein KC636_37420 [Myxococcales bacterium]|nr:hypothetical protein [Myxococcales bacterium]
MPPRLARSVLILAALLCGCLAENPIDTDATTTGTSDTAGTDTAGEDGLFACPSPPCTFVVVSQTLDDRVDVFEPGVGLRGRVDVDLKPDPSGQQIEGNLLDEPYELSLAPGSLKVLLGHYPDTDRASLVTFGAEALASVPAGGVLQVADYFTGGAFTGDVSDLPLAREEAIFLLEHPDGPLLVGVFNNYLKSADWSTPGQLLIVDPDAGAIGAFDLGVLDPPCQGAWGLTALADDHSRVAMACDGNDVVAIVDLPANLGALDVTEAAAALTGCSFQTPTGVSGKTTRFLAPDGDGGLLLAQSSAGEPPRLLTLDSGCSLIGLSSDHPAPYDAVRSTREVVAVPGAPRWLIAAGAPTAGVFVARGGQSPQLCGQVAGLDAHLDATNDPYALALDASGDHLVVGAGPSVNPELSEGRGQVLWVTLDTSGITDCAVEATAVVDLTDGLFNAADPQTWVRAPNVAQLLEIAGSG